MLILILGVFQHIFSLFALLVLCLLLGQFVCSFGYLLEPCWLVCFIFCNIFSLFWIYIVCFSFFGVYLVCSYLYALVQYVDLLMVCFHVDILVDLYWISLCALKCLWFIELPLVVSFRFLSA